MKANLKSALIVLLLVSVLCIPLPVRAVDIDIPPQAEGYVTDADIIEMISLMAWYRSGNVLAYLTALDQTLSPLISTSAELLGPEMPSITDVAGLRASYQAQLAAIANAASVDEARSLVAALETTALGLENQLRTMEAEMRGLEAPLRGQATAVENKIRAKIQAEVDSKTQEINAEINAIAEERAAAIRADTQARVEAALAGKNPNDYSEAEKADAQRQLDEFIAQSRADLTAEMNALGAQKEQELRDWAAQRAEELKGAEIRKFEALQAQFQSATARIQAAAAQQEAQYQQYYDQFLAKKRSIISAAMQPQYDTAVEQIRAHESDFQQAQANGRDIIPMNDLIGEFDTGWDSLVDTIAGAEFPEDIDEAVEGFKALWREKQRELEQARTQGAGEIIDLTLQKLAENDCEQRLADGRTKIETLIADIEARDPAGLDEKTVQRLRFLKAMLPLVDDAAGAIDEFKQATPDRDIADLLALRERLQEKLQNVENLAEYLDKMELPGDGIYIEAENESFTDLLPHTLVWHSHKELDNPTWRPPLSAGGLWYFSRPGETLGYYVDIVKPGQYTIWVRDIASLDWPVGARVFHVFVDGTDYGPFNEHGNRSKYPMGTFDWHPTATVQLSAGQHTLEIKKIEDTHAGPLIDAIYLTSTPGDDPRFMELAP